MPESPDIMPDHTMTAPDPKRIFDMNMPEKEADWRDEE